MEHPFRKALREARFVLVMAPLIAVAYNLFAATRIPWIREVRAGGDTASYTDIFGKNSPPPVAIDTPATHAVSAPIASDTGATAKVTVDTPKVQVKVPLTPQERLRIQDSIKKAAEATHPHKDTAKSTVAETTPTPVKPTEQVKEKTKEIGTALAKRIFDEKRALFIDARPAEQFAEGHIPGAINIYATDFNSHIPMLFNYSRDTLVVAYCSGGPLCELSHELADQLLIFGFKKVVVYTGGTTEWTDNHYPFTSQGK